MDIKYLGHASFLIKSKDARVVTDPFESSIGIKFSKTEADIVTVSHHHGDHDNVAAITGNPLILDWPGEFEKNGVRMFAYKSYHDKQKGAERGENVLFKFEIEGMSILHCGDLGFVPDNNFLEEIGEINILMVPVGGVYTIDPEEAIALIKKIEPNMVIPMHYNTEGLKQEAFGKLATLNDFLAKIGVTDNVPVPKLTVKKDDFGEEMKVVTMTISS